MCLVILALVVLGCVLFQSRYCRSVTLRELATGQTQTVSVAFMPYHADWKVSGEVHGSGTLMLSYVYSNQVSGKFSASGGGDYYDTNASAAFIPHGAARGEIRASFRFANWH
jgi:hypothetical protein